MRSFHYAWLRGKKFCKIHLVKPFFLENLNIHFVSSFSSLSNLGSVG